jgi:hypothetical protein
MVAENVMKKSCSSHGSWETEHEIEKDQGKDILQEHDLSDLISTTWPSPGPISQHLPIMPSNYGSNSVFIN